MSRAGSARGRERIGEDNELQPLAGGKASSASTGPKPGFKKISTTPASSGGTGWKNVGTAVPQKSEAESRWGNNGEDEYDPAYPTPA